MEAQHGAVAEVACSSYSTIAVTVDGRAYTWGDCDGDSLGHGVPQEQYHLEHNEWDADGDGLPNMDDADDDGDGVLTKDENDHKQTLNR